MGYTSNFANVVPFDLDGFNADRPCSAANAFLLRNNIAHMIDESPQVYINWAGWRDGADSSWVTFTKGPIVFSQLFLCSWVLPDRPANLDVFVTARSRGSDVTPTIEVLARVVPYTASIGDLTAPSMLDVTATLTSATAAILIDEQAFFTTPRPDLMSSIVDVDTNDEGVTGRARVSLMRFELAIRDITEDDPNESQVLEITSVMLAGFV